MAEIETKFLLTWYLMGFLGKRNPYPKFGALPFTVALLDSVEEAESILRKEGIKNEIIYEEFHEKTYCHVISELPMGIQFSVGESISERVYLPDGQLWGIRDHDIVIADAISPKYSESDYNRLISTRGRFGGRSPEEIRFKKGDIIEMFTPITGRGGSVELAVVVDTPPTKEDIKERMALYKNKRPPRHLRDRGFIGARFGSYDDYYLVISDCTLKDAYLYPTFCPTHYAMKPRFEISPEIRTQMQDMFEKYEKHRVENDR